MKSPYSLIILFIFISCTKSDLNEDLQAPPEFKKHISNIPDDTTSIEKIYQSTSIRYKARFNFYTCKLKSSSHNDIHAYISNSRLILRSKTKCLTGATHLYYNDIDDYEANVQYPRFGTYTIGGYSYLTISISKSIACVDRVELTLKLDDNCGLNIPQMRD